MPPDLTFFESLVWNGNCQSLPDTSGKIGGVGRGSAAGLHTPLITLTGISGLENPVCSLRHDYLELGALPRFPGFVDGDAGDSKDLPGDEESKTRILSKSLLKDLSLP